ncbi:MAG: hypothetical protein K1X64_02565 [Myxococcaceae bacterium]|nr:hypothetical protein [Myxococcaceae bacterium]
MAKQLFSSVALLVTLLFVACTPRNNNGNGGNGNGVDGGNNTGADGGEAFSCDDAGSALNGEALANARRMLTQGQQTFRYETFGDEAFWGGTLRLHHAILGEAHGGVGAGVTPTAALAVGLKVDVDALPADLQEQLRNQQVNLESVDTTIALLRLNAIVGVTGVFDQTSGTNLASIGIQCAFCHSTVDDSFAPGIGRRIDGAPNRNLNVGAIVNLSPDLSAVQTLLNAPDGTVRQVLMGWGPGKFDAALFLDGKGLRPDGKTAATLIPPAYGLAGVNLHSYTGWGSVTYWNAFVANLEMHGKGTFYDPRLSDETKFPVAAANHFANVRNKPDLVTPKLAALHFYQLALQPPVPPAGSFDAAKAGRGQVLFDGAARCASCHVPPLFTEPGWSMHTPEEIGIDDFQASRSPDGRYRTTPLRGLWARSTGGFYHDGRFATLLDVVNHYNGVFTLELNDSQKSDLVEYLKSI